MTFFLRFAGDLAEAIVTVASLQTTRAGSLAFPILSRSTLLPRSMQPASPDRSPAIRRLGAWTPMLRRFHKSRKHSPKTGAIGTPNAHHLLETLDNCYTTSSFKSEARTVEITPCEENIAQGPQLRLQSVVLFCFVWLATLGVPVVAPGTAAGPFRRVVEAP